MLCFLAHIIIYLRKGDFAESYVKLQYRRVSAFDVHMNLHLKERPSIELTHMNSEKSAEKHPPVQFRWGSRKVVSISFWKKKNTSVYNMSFHRGFYQNSTQKKTKTLQAKPILLQAKPFRPFKRSSTQVRRLTIAMVADLSYIPWGMILLWYHIFPFPIRPKGTKVLRRCCKTNWECLAAKTSNSTAPLFLDRPAFFDPKKHGNAKAPGFRRKIIPNNK